MAELEGRDYETMEDPSLLRFLVDMRGADATEKQLRDDLVRHASQPSTLCINPPWP